MLHYNPVMSETKYGAIMDSTNATIKGLTELIKNDLKDYSDE